MTMQLLSRWTCDDCGTMAEVGCGGAPTGWFWWIPHIGVTKHRCPACEVRLRAEDPTNATHRHGHGVNA